MNHTIAKRIRQHRIHQEIPAATLAAAMGLADEAELERIETEQQKVTAEQMLAAIEVFGVDMDAMTDPFRLGPGEGQWNWRIRPEEPEEPETSE